MLSSTKDLQMKYLSYNVLAALFLMVMVALTPVRASMTTVDAKNFMAIDFDGRVTSHPINLQTPNVLDHLLLSLNKQKEVKQTTTPLTFKESDVAIRKTINTYNKKAFQTGTASWYGPRFYGRKTASGEVFTKTHLTAAHRTLPFGTKLRVTNQKTGESVVVKVNDRGPFHGNRIIDLSHAAASKIGLIESGLCKVVIEKI